MWLPRRVDKHLRECTHRSLVELRAACVSGRVTITRLDETAIVASADELVFDEDLVHLDGLVLSARRSYDYVAFHKPLDTISTVRDPQGQADLSTWLSQLPEGVFPVGRLDRMTTGLLLFTNDGDFANAILHPVHHVEKRYSVWLDGHLDRADPRLDQLVTGVTLRDHAEPLRATSAAIVHTGTERTELLVTLREGKHRQIRKMCQALGLRLVGLHRLAIGAVSVRGLVVGDWRHLTADEVDGLWADAGGKTLVFERQLHALRLRAQLARDARQPNHRLEQWLGRATLDGSSRLVATR